jgi:hypothetical protein
MTLAKTSTSESATARAVRGLRTEKILAGMLRLAGIPISDTSARWLVSALYRDGHADSVQAALAIENVLDSHLSVVPLTVTDRRAILSVLDDPPNGLLDLRALLTLEARMTPRRDAT